MTYDQINDNTIIIREFNSHYDIIGDLGKYLFGRKTNFCKKCMSIVKDNLNHVCLTESLCIKCYSSSCKSKRSTRDTCSKYSLCDIYFYYQTCLSEHYNKKYPTPQGDRLSTCQLFKYCNDCNSIIRRFSFRNYKGHKKITVAITIVLFPFLKNNKIEIYVYDF